MHPFRKTRSNVQSLIVSSAESLYRVLDRINQGGKGIAFVVNSKEHFLGTITDGDIRRAILAKCSLETPTFHLLDKNSFVFNEILNSYHDKHTVEKLKQSSISAPIHTPLKELLQLVNDRVKIIPLVDHRNKVVDYFEYESSFYAPIASPNIKGNEINYIIDCIETNWISSQGKYVDLFEKQFAQFCGAKFGVAVCNGTAALHLALVAAGIGNGDEVIVPDLTFAATVNSVLHAGATPVIVDIEEDSWCIDPDRIQSALTPKTKAILPVHLYGQPANMIKIKQIAEKNDLIIIEDCAEAIGAKMNGKNVGSWGNIGCFSFFGNKIITTGEGGMCVTSDDGLRQKLRCFRDHGMSHEHKYWHKIIGYNYRLTNLQAAIGVAQLEKIDRILYRRTQIRNMYEKRLGRLSVMKRQNKLPDRDSVVWLVSYLLDPAVDRNKLISAVKKMGVDLRPFFYPLSKMPLYKKFARSFSPVAHNLSCRGLNLPTSVSFSDFEIIKIAKIIEKQVERLVGARRLPKRYQKAMPEV